MWNSLGILLLLQLVIYSEALYEGCDNAYNVNANQALTVNSPYYSSRYKAGTSCRYTISAAIDYELQISCSMNMDKAYSTCSTEYFYLATDGDKSLNGAEQFCGSGNIARVSLFRTLVFAYVSKAASNSTAGGTFSCTITARPQACDCGWSARTRIVNGTRTTIGEFPSMVALYSQSGQKYFCGASIINHYTIVTAAHCMREYPNYSDILAVVGDYDLSKTEETKYTIVYSIAKIIQHYGYNPPGSEANDISLLITVYPIEWSRGVGPICLTWKDTSYDFVYKDTDVIGWGTIKNAGLRSDILLKATVSVIPNSNCAQQYPNLQASQVCTFFPYKDSCQYDSGGPCVFYGSAARQFLLGVISYGKNCGGQSNAAVNTRLTSFLTWITQNAKDGFCQKNI